MSLVSKIKRLRFIDYLIQRKATGTPDRLSSRIGISKRSLAEMIKEMKELGFPIKYDKYRQSYRYEEEGGLVESLFINKYKLPTLEQMRLINSENLHTLCFSESKIFKKCPLDSAV